MRFAATPPHEGFHVLHSRETTGEKAHQGIVILNRAMFGTKDAVQYFDSYCERTMEKVHYNIGVFNQCLYNHLHKDVGVLRHADDFATLATRIQMQNSKKT